MRKRKHNERVGKVEVTTEMYNQFKDSIKNYAKIVNEERVERRDVIILTLVCKGFKEASLNIEIPYYNFIFKRVNEIVLLSDIEEVVRINSPNDLGINNIHFSLVGHPPSSNGQINVISTPIGHSQIRGYHADLTIADEASDAEEISIEEFRDSMARETSGRLINDTERRYAGNWTSTSTSTSY